MIKRSILIKFMPNEDLSPLFLQFGFYVTKTLEHIQSLIEPWQRIKEPKKAKCDRCKEERFIVYKNDEEICSYCFSKIWSEFTLFKEWKPKLMEINPKFTGNQGYYYGAISTATNIVTSYLTKKTQREKEIERAKGKTIELEGLLNKFAFDIKKTKIKIKEGKNLTKELAQLEKEEKDLLRNFKSEKKRALRKQVSFPIFRNNEVFFGKQGMFEFEHIANGYLLYISDYRVLRTKIQCQMRIGDLRKYHKKCRKEVFVKNGLFDCIKCGIVPKNECSMNYQEQFILKCIEKKEHKIVYPKMIRRFRNGILEHYFLFPTRDLSNVKSREEIEKMLKKKDIEVCCLSFGIKKPITMVTFKNKKIIDIHSFGDGKVYWKGEFDREIKAKIYNSIGEKYKHTHPHADNDRILHQKKRKALLKVNKKIGFRLQRFVNFYSQKLSYDVVNYAKTKFNNPIFILRDTKGIKDISYKGYLMKSLSRWNLEQQKKFIEYKSDLNNIPIYNIPYKEVSEVTCSKCGEKTKEKVTTQLLKFEEDFKCEKCKYSNNFLVNDSINLYNVVTKKV